MKRLFLLSILFFTALQISFGGNLYIKEIKSVVIKQINQQKNQKITFHNNKAFKISNSNSINKIISKNNGSFIVAYEYWFDSNYASKVFQHITPDSDYLLNSGIQANKLATGFHTVHIRFKDNSNRWSSVINWFFIKQPASNSNNAKITACEYWFDNNYSSKKLKTISPADIFNDTILITSGIPKGVHSVHIRYKDNFGRWSSIESRVFVKQSSSKYKGAKIIVREYWFDNNYSSRVLKTIFPTNVYHDTLISTFGLPPGIHTLHIRYKNNFNGWSSVKSIIFYKKKHSNSTTNLITAYRYWFDTLNRKAVFVNLPSPKHSYVLDTNIKLQGLNVGSHTINFQFMDASRLWSSVFSDSININTAFSSAEINTLKNGPSENVYSIPENGTGYAYFSMVNTDGQPVIHTNSFNISLSNQTNRKYQATGLFIKPGILRIAIPGKQITSSNGVPDTITIKDNIQIGDTLYRLNSTPLVFNVVKVQPDFTRTFDFFADESAGISGLVGSVGLGASIAMAKISITGTAGIGLRVTVDPDNNLKLSRRFEAGIGTDLEIPAVNTVIGKVSAGIGAGVSTKTILSQEISLTGLKNLTPDQVMMTQAGFILETLSMGIGNFSPTLGIFRKAIKQSLFKTSGISQELKVALIKNSWGIDVEGTVSSGFSADWGVVRFNIANSSMTGVLSGRTNYYPKGLPAIGNAVSSTRLTMAVNFDFSLLNFSFANKDGISLGSGNMGLFAGGTGMETSAEIFLNSSQQLQRLDLSLTGGGGLHIFSSNNNIYYKTDIEIPGEYQNIFTKNDFAIDGLMTNKRTVNLNDLLKNIPGIIYSVSNNFIRTPITIKTYEKIGNGKNLFLGVDLDAALGVGLGVKFGVDLKYYNELSYLKKYTLVYNDNNNYLMSSENYSNQMSSYNVSNYLTSLIKGTAGIVKTSFLGYMATVNKIVNRGKDFALNAKNLTGKFVGSVNGNIQKNGKWFINTFSPNFNHLWKKSFAEPVIQNFYYSTKIQHKETFNNKSALVNVTTTMVAVSDNMKISFIPDGDTISVDSVDTAFTIKMVMDTTLLHANGFTLADSSRIKIYRYNDADGNWIMVEGILHGDTLEASTKYMENYLLGIELTNADDKTAPAIIDYGPKHDSIFHTYPKIFAQIRDNKYGVGVNWNKTFLIANGDTLNASFNPSTQTIFYNLSGNDSLINNVNVKVWTEDYNGNCDSLNFSFRLTITGIHEQEVGKGFKLKQNYPNPFSSATRINYSLPKLSKVKIMVFSSTGDFITTLVQAQQPAGNYSVAYDGVGLPNGIYFYSFAAQPLDGSNGYRETKKMRLTRDYY